MQAAVQPLAILRLPPFRAAKPSSTRRPSFQRHLQQRSQPAGWGRHRRRPPQPCATAAANATPGPAASPYGILGVAPGATQQEIKASYRRLALKVHPDVSEAPDADARFAALAAAYDTLSDPRSRRLYDLYGVEGMKKYSGAGAGRGNARRAWDEFKPHIRENKRTRARAAAAAQAPPPSVDASGDSSCSGSQDSDASASTDGDGAAGEDSPQAGDVVEYPLSELIQAALQDGRTHGVGLLVGRNIDRGDAARLPPEALQLCEVEPLRQEVPGSGRWIPDELAPSAFCRLPELRRVAITSYDRRFDVWCFPPDSLSEGCGGPELPEEVML